MSGDMSNPEDREELSRRVAEDNQRSTGGSGKTAVQ